MAGGPSYCQEPGVAVTIIEGEAAIVTVTDSRLHLVNRVGTRIWELCGSDGRTLEELVAALRSEFDVGEAVARAECSAFLDAGVAAGFLCVRSLSDETGAT